LVLLSPLGLASHSIGCSSRPALLTGQELFSSFPTPLFVYNLLPDDRLFGVNRFSICMQRDRVLSREHFMRVVLKLVLSLFAVAVFFGIGALRAQERASRSNSQETSSPMHSSEPTKAAASQDSAGGALHRLFDTEWDYQMEQNPTWASRLGDRRWNDRWEDASLEAIRKRHDHDLGVLAELKRIDRSRLTRADQVNYDLFEKNYGLDVEGFQFHTYLMPVSQMDGIQTANELADALRFESVKDYEDWIARLRSFPRYMQQTTALMRQGIAERILLPKVILQKVTPEIDNQIVKEPESSPFYLPFKHFPASMAAPDRERLTQEAKAAIATGVVPSFRKFREFFVNEYLAASFDPVGIWQVPHGDRLYVFLIRRETTTNLTPQQIHETGLREVARIHGEMMQILNQVGFKGSLQDFFKFLRTDPRFYYKDPKDLQEAYEVIAKTIDPRLVKVFRVLPRMPYGVEPIPAESAPVQTTAYYRAPAADGSRAGTFFVNLYKPETRPKWEMMALALHEAVPGHHLQIALAMELGEMPKFRRYGGYTAFVEGWALYAESLGEEMGLYEDPYSKFGELTYDMWRAVRLVVDTGMHFMKWDRLRAIDFFMENTPKQELDITNEIDRYIAWPGQALAYKAGQLKIRELRAKASRDLGDKFDLRDFHNAVLSAGAVPLDILEQQVDAWIASQRETINRGEERKPSL
jgi:uncharacterized protein (DUF885 family)